MAEKKKTESVETPLTMEAVKAEVAAIIAAAQQEADRIIAEAKQSANAKPVNSSMSSEELAAYNAYMNEYVEVELFKDNGQYKDDVFVAVNGENCVIKRGERVQIKRKFAEVLENSAKQRKEAARFSESKSAEWEKKSKAIQ